MFHSKFNYLNEEPIFFLKKGVQMGVQKGVQQGSRLGGPHFVVTHTLSVAEQQ